MSKKVHKGFFSYLFIFLGIALAFVLVCAVIMICSPGTKIFGLSYYKVNGSIGDFNSAVVYDSAGEPVTNADGSYKKIEVNTANTDISNFKTIEINANLFDVAFGQKSDDDSAGSRDMMSILISADAKGFTKGEITKLKFAPKYFEDTKTLQINLEIPQGFLNFSSSNKITVQMPRNFDSEFNIVVNSQAGNVQLGASGNLSYTPNTLTASSINITTTSGKIETTKYFKSVNALKDCSLTTENGDINIGRAIVCKNLKVTTKTGEVNFSNDILTVGNQFTFNANHSFLTINKISAKNINFAAKSGKIYANEITGNVEFSDLTNNCDLQVKSIEGFLKIGTFNEENISTKTNINVTNYVSGLCSICTVGDITIGEIKGTTKLRTQSGNINIAKVNGEIDITTFSSQIVLGKIVDDNGDIVDKGINGKVLISGSDNANITTYFKNVADGSTIYSKKGNINVIISPSASCKITATAKNITLDNNSQTSPLNYQVNNGSQAFSIISEESNIDIKVA